ncbi:Tellurium resistance [Streptomyces sp. B1866]|uniref:TerD family protein n=1 Tax=Streptomyces sp. B1866 TaxID=3075431 RepID=UPI00288CFAD8|nr:Tellurium resistance [Streptomyces sp. B1866]MDT3398019.1 Tellurium resistance [Streptomyces sp. B1866]
MAFWDNWGRGPWRQFDSGGGSGTIELTRRRPTVSLSKQGAATGNLRVNLSWQMRTTDFGERQSLRESLLRNPFKKLTPDAFSSQGPALVNVDLDLACLYELKDGSKGVVQPLGNFMGSLNSAPYVKLDGDDRFGSGTGETIFVNMDHKDDIERLLVFVYIYDGTPAFDRTRGVVTLYPSSGPQVVIHLDERDAQARSCAVVQIKNVKGEMVVRREVRYVYGFQSELDRLYGWGLQWGRGYKEKV